MQLPDLQRTDWPSVAIIVLTWNQQEVTLECLASLRELDYPQAHLAIILVDNGSSDGTAEAVRAAYPEVTVLVNAENLGFAGGNNVGLRYALTTDAAYVMLLNNDTVVDPPMLKHLVAVAESDSAIGIVGPKMLYHSQPEIIWCAGNAIDWRSGATVRLGADLPAGADDRCSPEDVGFITACALCARREVLETVGLLDPRFFIYYEETDWCARAHSAGWRIVYVPQARLWHKVSAAMGTTSPATDYYMNRNVVLFLRKNLPAWAGRVAAGRAMFRNLLTVAAYTLKPRGGMRRPNRNVRALAVRDALLRRWGKMPADVEAICYPGKP